MFKLSLFLSVFVSKSIAGNPCPQHWTDATHVDLGCLLFNVTNPSSWLEGQDSCAKNPQTSWGWKRSKNGTLFTNTLELLDFMLF